jgi:lipid-binding SYLF domain-containing protein
MYGQGLLVGPCSFHPPCVAMAHGHAMGQVARRYRPELPMLIGPRTLSALVVPILWLAAPGAARGNHRNEHDDVLKTIAEFKEKDPGIAKFFSSAAGYAVFPSVAKGAIGIGAAKGDGELLVGGKAVGSAELTQVTVGLQLGGQEYSEVIFFEKQSTVDAFRRSELKFAAQASAVALKSGASANAKYASGVLVFTMAKGGLMFEASIGGQKFSFTPYK